MSLDGLLIPAFSGDADALRRLAVGLLPIIQIRVARALLRWSSQAAGRDRRQELEDLSHEVLLSMLVNDGRALRGWDESRGLSFESFVGLIAEREVISIMRIARRNPWTEEPTVDEGLDSPDEKDVELRIESHQLLERLLARLRVVLSPQGHRVFELLFIRQLGVPEVCTHTGLNRDAVYAWRSRLRRIARTVRDDLSPPVESSREASR